MGSVSAGFPSAAEEELQDTITLDEYLITNKEASCLITMSDDAMTPAGIMRDDIVIVQRGKVASLGDIVIAHVDNEWFIRRLDRSDGKQILKADNSLYEPISTGSEVRIDGVVTGVVRKYH
jgi:SOS-response transcriptional repressor LexA